MGKILEVCIDSLASARAAIEGGADRIELCGALSVGGLTPYTELLTQIRNESDIDIRSMIRPRGGDFLYSEDELEMMIMQIKTLKSAGSNGFVIGCLKRDGTPDEEAIKRLMEACGDSKVTFHRAIDVSRDLLETYSTISRLGVDTVLTSGGEPNCTNGKEKIGALLELKEKINGANILIGAGVNASVIRDFRSSFPTAENFHLSGKIEVESQMEFRRLNIPMGHPAFDEWHIGVTSAEKIRLAKSALLL